MANKLLFILVITCNSVFAQYNFFIGEDAPELSPTARGFGSISFPSIMINQSKIFGYPKKIMRPFLSVNLGVNSKQWRFDDNIALKRDDMGIVVAMPHPEHEVYKNNFFSYSKSKFTLSSIRIRPEFGFTTANKKFSIATGPLFEIYLSAKHKRKYFDNQKKSKFTQPGIDYYNINTYQFGWGASIGMYHFGAFSYVMITPLFKENLGPKVYAAEVGLYWRILRENIDNFKVKRISRIQAREFN